MARFRYVPRSFQNMSWLRMRHDLLPDGRRQSFVIFCRNRRCCHSRLLIGSDVLRGWIFCRTAGARAMSCFGCAGAREGAFSTLGHECPSPISGWLSEDFRRFVASVGLPPVRNAPCFPEGKVFGMSLTNKLRQSGSRQTRASCANKALSRLTGVASRVESRNERSGRISC